MPVQQQTIPFQFIGGLNSRVDEFQLANNELLQANNVRFTKDGAIDKRTGTICLSNDIIGGGKITQGVACQVYNNELLVFDGTFIYSYIESQQAWINRGIAVSTINTQKKIFTARIAQQDNPDGTNLDGLQCFIWEDASPTSIAPNVGVRYSIIDTQTGAFIVTDQSIYAFGYGCKVLADHVNSLFHIYYQASNQVIFYHTISTATPQLISAPTEIIVDGYANSANIAYDVCMVDDVATIYYGAQDGLRSFDGSTSTLLIPGITASCLGVYQGIFGDVWVAYGNTSVTPAIVNVLHVNTDTNVTIESNPISNIAVIEADPGTASVTYEVNSSDLHFLNNITLSGSDTVFFGPTQNKVGLASKPFKIGQQIFINAVYQSPNQSTYFTFLLNNAFHAISKINDDVSGNYRNNGLLPQCDNFSNLDLDDLDITQQAEIDNLTRNVMFANQKKGAFTSANGTTYSLLGLNASYIDFNDLNAFNSVTAARNLHIVGGIEKVYDGISVVEDNFHLYPENLDDGYAALVIPVPGGNLQTGEYQLTVCYEWTDNNGQVQRSAPGIPVTIQATAGQGLYIAVQTLPVTDKINPRSPVSIAIFRTIIQQGIPSTIFYKVTADNSPLVNNTAVETVIYTDLSTDDSLAGNEPLYTSEQLPNAAPPSCSLISNYQTRVFLSGLEDPNVMWFSQEQFELDNYNTIPTEFSSLLFQGVDGKGGGITAIQVLDSNLVIFKENTIFLLNGDGPNANATSGQFSAAVKVVSDTGCSNANSIVEIPGNDFNSGGLMYKSDKGIYLFDRGQQNHYIGKKMQDYNFLTIVSAEILNNQNEVIFISQQGIHLVYNYEFDRWTTWSYLPAVDSCLWTANSTLGNSTGISPNLVLLQSDGIVRVQQDDIYVDYSPNADKTLDRPVNRTVQLPWLAFAGIQGYQSVFYAVILGHYISPHILNISVCYDYKPTPREPASINSNVVSNLWGSLPLWGSPPNWGGGLPTPYQFQYYLDYPWCQSFSLIINDVPYSDPNHPELQDTDRGVILSAITFQVGIFDKAVRIPPRNRVSGPKSTQ